MANADHIRNVPGRKTDASGRARPQMSSALARARPAYTCSNQHRGELRVRARDTRYQVPYIRGVRG